MREIISLANEMEKKEEEEVHPLFGGTFLACKSRDPRLRVHAKGRTRVSTAYTTCTRRKYKSSHRDRIGAKFSSGRINSICGTRSFVILHAIVNKLRIRRCSLAVHVRYKRGYIS